MIAIARRIFGAVFILAGLLCLCWPSAGVWRLELKDYGKAYSESRGTGNGNKPGALVPGKVPTGLEQYIQKKTRRRARKVEGQTWEELFRQTAQNRGDLYLPAATELLAQAAQQSGSDLNYFILPDKYPVFLVAALSSNRNASAYGRVSWAMTHPHAWLTPWLFGIGLLVYIFLPRPKRRKGQARYHRMRSQIGPDLLALILGSVFLVLPLFIITENAEHPQPLSMDGGWALLTLVCWFIALLMTANLAIAAWYEALYFQITPSGVTKVNLKGSENYSFAQMIEMRAGFWRPPAWFRKLAWIVVLINPGLAPAVILGSQETAPWVEVPCKNDRTLSIYIKHLQGWPELEKSLLNSGLQYVEIPPKTDDT